MPRKYSKAAQKKVKKVMKERKSGTLRSAGMVEAQSPEDP